MQVNNFASGSESVITMIDQDVKNTLTGALENVNAQLQKIAMSNGQGDMSEIEMMQLNIAVSRFNTFITLASGIYKNLTDGEKTIAQKM